MFRPNSAPALASAVKELVALDQSGILCPFAVRGGGHTAWAGSANIDGGVTIDLRSLNWVTTDTPGVVAVGAGAKWGDVYGALALKNLTVVGGRISSVGVAGLTLGGEFTSRAFMRALVLQ